MPLMRQSTNEYPKTENYYPHWSLEIQISQCTLSFPLFLAPTGAQEVALSVCLSVRLCVCVSVRDF